MADWLRQQVAPWPLELAFLELAEPDIHQAVGQLLAQPIDGLVVCPLLLFAAGHARRDIPHAVQRALEQWGAGRLPVVQAEPLGCHEAIVELSVQQCTVAVGGRLHPETDCLLLVGRGTSDRAAQGDFLEFATRRRAAAGVPVEPAFLAQARPTLDQQLQRVANRGVQRVVVQPHLLFAGEVMEAVYARVAATARAHPQMRWVVVPPLAEGILRCSRQRGLWMEAMVTRLQETGIRVVAPWRHG